MRIEVGAVATISWVNDCGVNHVVARVMERKPSGWLKVRFSRPSETSVVRGRTFEEAAREFFAETGRRVVNIRTEPDVALEGYEQESAHTSHSVATPAGTSQFAFDPTRSTRQRRKQRIEEYGTMLVG